MFDPNNLRVNPNPREEGEYTPDDQIIKPTQPPRPAKEFKKFLVKNRHDQSEEDALAAGGTKKVATRPPKKNVTGENQKSMGTLKDDEENASDSGTVSLFDLSAKAAQTSKQNKMGDALEKPVAKIESPHPISHLKSPELEKAAQTSKPIEHEALPVKETKYTTRYTQEQPDLSYVNPLAAVVQPVTNSNISSSSANVAPVSRVDLAMIDLIEQVIKGMYTVDTQGQTDTVITLQYPPLLKDAQVVVSAFDTAHKQFNISFENLTQAAQQVLSLESNKKALMDALHDKGYGVQIMTFTTAIEHPNPVDESAFRGNREQEGRGQQQHGQKEEETA